VLRIFSSNGGGGENLIKEGRGGRREDVLTEMNEKSFF
jgi:hypothetical protein